MPQTFDTHGTNAFSTHGSLMWGETVLPSVADGRIGGVSRLFMEAAGQIGGFGEVFGG